MIVFLLLPLILCLIYFIYRKGRSNEDAFADSIIKYSKPEFMFGHIRRLMFRQQDHYEFIKSVYREFPAEKANGIWEMRTPYVLLRDPALVKQVAVKDFDHFTDHKLVFDKKMDSLMGNVLIALTGSKWRDMRATLSPAFTGSKMRLMFQLIEEITGQLTTYLKEACRKSSSSGAALEFDMKDICSKYTNDVIALCAFGIQVDTLKNPKNEFYEMGRSVMNPSLRGVLKFMMIRFFPQLLKWMSLLSPMQKRFFSGMVLDTMKHREANNIKRPDMINLLMEVKQGMQKNGEQTTEEENMKPQWTDDEIVAQCLVFFLAGFETSSTVMTITAYELVVNPDIQQKLYEEIRAKQDELDAENRKLSYDDLKSLKYLDMVVCESLRKWPPAAVTDRKCTKPFDYKDEETGLELHLKPGSNLWIPIHGFHHDPQYFPEPERFYPERFSEENKQNINQDAYMPFGVGPRSCIANRFALMELKAMLYALVLNFELVVTKKTNIPLKITSNFGAIAKDIFLGLKERKW